MKILIGSLIIVFAFILSNCGSSCDSNTTDAIASLYALTLSSPDMVPQFVNENRALMVSDDFNDCIDNFSKSLMEGALSAPSRNEVYEHSMSIATDAGYSEMGPKVADDMMKTYGDMLRLSQFMQQIKMSVKNIDQGNIQAYKNTEIYYLSSTIWNMSANILYPQQIQSLRQMMFKLCYWYVSKLLQAA